MEILKSLLSIAIMLYVALFLIAVTISDKLIFLPPSPTYQDGDDTVKVSTKRGYRISAAFLDASNASNYTGYTLLYSHGNAEDLGHVMPQIRMLFEQGFSVFAYDYSGYGTSGGTASEKNALADIEDVYAHLLENTGLTPDQIIIMGYSVGSGPSTYLAAKYRTAGLILQSAFVSTIRVRTVIKIFPFDKLDNIAIIDQVNSPVLFIHGDEDSIIPIWHSRALYEKANSPKFIYPVSGAGHNDLIEGAGTDYFEQLKKFSRSL